MSRPGSLCLYCISVSRSRFDVATSFLLSASLLLGHSFSFRLRHHSVVLGLQVGRDSILLVYLFSCRDVDIRSRPSGFFNHCNSCRNLKSMSQPFFLPILSQPCFLLTTVSHQVIFFFWSRPRKCVATEWLLFLPMLLSQLLKCSRDINT